MYVTLACKDPDWAADTVRDIAVFAGEHREVLRSSWHDGRFLRDLYQEMGRRGWVGPLTPLADGGSGGGVAEYCLIEEEVGRHGLVSPQISIQGQRWLLDWGTEDQRAKYLRGIASGEVVFSESISEPGVGSSMKLMETTATRDGSDWIIHGHKSHVNLGGECDVTLVYANAAEGLTAFLVDMDTPGVTAQQTDPIGLRLIPTADIIFDHVRIPADTVLGDPGKGMDTFFSTFNTSRLGNASELIGFARQALAEAIAYAEQRPVGDNVVTDFQGIQWTVADCYTELYGASLARDWAATLADRDIDHALETTLAKKLAIDAAEHSVNESFALVGGYGLYTNTDFGRVLHDMKVLRVAGGSLEVLRNYIARRVLKEPPYAGLR